MTRKVNNSEIWKLLVVGDQDSERAKMVQNAFQTEVSHVTTTVEYENVRFSGEEGARFIIVMIDSDYWMMLSDESESTVLLYVADTTIQRIKPFHFVQAYWSYWETNEDKLRRTILTAVEDVLEFRVEIP